MLRALAIANYRSLRHLVLPLARLTVITGANGSGKSSVYRALRLLADTAQGGVIRSLAREGGLSSVLWAGPESFSAAMLRGEVPVQGTSRKDPVNLRLGFSSDDGGFGYAIDIGLPRPSSSLFARDPEIKREAAWAGAMLRPAATLAQREGMLLQLRNHGGSWQAVGRGMPAYASMLAEHADPAGAPELITLRDQVRAWRFYDHFRSDADAPARQPQLGTRTNVLNHDGSDLAAAIATIQEIGDSQALAIAVSDAFEGAQLLIDVQGDRFEVLMRQPGLLRPLRTAELSDGTLRYLLLVAALLTPRPPPLLVLNEPESSLHPDLLPALGRLIAQASGQSQLIVVTHSSRLLAALEAAADADYLALVLEKRLGETHAAGFADDDRPAWRWPSR
ncbi:MAG: ATP-binding protein [Burkholderiales bacterium]|nr:MAG: ATP-binding protein [Burkholderiales bacterium]